MLIVFFWKKKKDSGREPLLAAKTARMGLNSWEVTASIDFRFKAIMALRGPFGIYTAEREVRIVQPGRTDRTGWTVIKSILFF